MKVQVKEATAAAALAELEGSKNPAVLELAKSLRAVVDRPEDRGRMTADELRGAIMSVDYACGFLPSRGGPLTEEQHAAARRAQAKMSSQLTHELERTKREVVDRVMSSAGKS